MSSKPNLSLPYAIPDHPWVDTSEGAAVRISMTVGSVKNGSSRLALVVKETESEYGVHNVYLEESTGCIMSDLVIGRDSGALISLESNSNISARGVIPHGSGFILNEEAARILGWPDCDVIKKYKNGRDITQLPRSVFAIDLYGYEENEVRKLYPNIYQHLLTCVKPERDHNPRISRRERWWLFAENQPRLRDSISKLKRCVVTPQTAKHRFFVFLDSKIIPDDKLVVVATDDAYDLGILSSQIHVTTALSFGGRLEDRPVYDKTRCFDPFPFPECPEAQKQKIRTLAEELDAHRKKAQAAHGVGLTDMYNVLEKIRAGEVLDAKEKELHDRALVSTLKQLHDDLDAAVAAAYGWPWPLPESEILERVVALNKERAEEESRGLIRWLRPEYQIPRSKTGKQQDLGLTAKDAKGAKKKGKAESGKRKAKTPWPKTLPEQVKVVAELLGSAGAPQTAEQVTAQFARVKVPQVQEILEALTAMGLARKLSNNSYSL